VFEDVGLTETDVGFLENELDLLSGCSCLGDGLGVLVVSFALFLENAETLGLPNENTSPPGLFKIMGLLGKLSLLLDFTCLEEKTL
jgi:hypothetical protein